MRRVIYGSMRVLVVSAIVVVATTGCAAAAGGSSPAQYLASLEGSHRLDSASYGGTGIIHVDMSRTMGGQTDAFRCTLVAGGSCSHTFLPRALSSKDRASTYPESFSYVSHADDWCDECDGIRRPTSEQHQREPPGTAGRDGNLNNSTRYQRSVSCPELRRFVANQPTPPGSTPGAST
ncbi:MAG: hypothetical protein JWQ39_2193 [Glaciihabitans sp.]|nr:hypothetical protein [Glaciihabitans sp.]